MTSCSCHLCTSSNGYARGGPPPQSHGLMQAITFPHSSFVVTPRVSLHTENPGQRRPPLPVEHTAQALRGFRTWSLHYDNQDQIDRWNRRIGWYGEGVGPTPGKLLPGLYGWSASSSQWTTPLTVAECPTQPAKHLFAEWYGTPNILAPHAPDRACKCGLYAWHRPENVEDDTVVGVVEGAGRVLWAPYGWRAEKARIVALYGKTDAVREMLAATHPEAKLYDSRDAMVEDWPAEVEAPEESPEDPFVKAYRNMMMRNLTHYGQISAAGAAALTAGGGYGLYDISGDPITAAKPSRRDRFTDWMVKHPVQQAAVMTATFAVIAFLLGLAMLIAGLVPAIALIGWPACAAGGYLAGTALFQGVRGIVVLMIRLGRKRG